MQNVDSFEGDFVVLAEGNDYYLFKDKLFLWYVLKNEGHKFRFNASYYSIYIYIYIYNISNLRVNVQILFTVLL